MAFTREEARSRNFAKMRLMGFRANLGQLVGHMTYDEKVSLEIIAQTLNGLVNKWDKRTEILTGHPLPPYKCELCGKRSNIPHIVREPDYSITDPNSTAYIDHNYCAKHAKETLEGFNNIGT